jgi:hypothetical protein
VPHPAEFHLRRTGPRDEASRLQEARTHEVVYGLSSRPRYDRAAVDPKVVLAFRAGLTAELFHARPARSESVVAESLLGQNRTVALRV